MSDLVSGVLTRISELEQCATAAGHGFGHLGLSRLLNLNAGWTQLDLTDNVRPTYDQRFVREFGPDAVLRLCRAHRQIVDMHVRTKRLLDQANGRVLQQVMDGTVATRQEQRDFDSLHVEKAVLQEVIEALAVGLGVVEEDRNGE